jgi:hypothetical protein
MRQIELAVARGTVAIGRPDMVRKSVLTVHEVKRCGERITGLADEYLLARWV